MGALTYDAIGADTGSLADAVALFKRDPVVGFVAIAVAAARPPNPGQVVQVGGRAIRLPKWSVLEWNWYARLAILVATRVVTEVKKAGGGADDVRDLTRAATRAAASSVRLNNGDLSDESVAAYYDAHVRLIIAAAAVKFAAEHPTTFQDALGEALLESLKDIPATIAGSLAFGRDTAVAVVGEAAKILAELFASAVKGIGKGIGLGGGAILLALGLWYLSSRSRNRDTEE